MRTVALAVAYPYLLARAGLASLRSRRQGGPGAPFAAFGREIGVRLVLKGYREGAELLVRPVESVRYFEFPFALRCCPRSPARCLDVGSPRLFSLYMAHRFPETTIRVINPDPMDVATTTRLAGALRLGGLRVEVQGVDGVGSERAQYDCIWSLSVLEHIAGDYDDREAVRWMYDALAEGGRLILTVPVDRAYREEYRETDAYGTQPAINGRYFFQRVYDRRSIWERIFNAANRKPDVIAWFGERIPGHFAAYERAWMQRGLFATVDDPKDIAEHYMTFPSWEAMPGQGVCGLMFQKRSGVAA